MTRKAKTSAQYTLYACECNAECFLRGLCGGCNPSCERKRRESLECDHACDVCGVVCRDRTDLGRLLSDVHCQSPCNATLPLVPEFPHYLSQVEWSTGATLRLPPAGRYVMPLSKWIRNYRQKGSRPWSLRGSEDIVSHFDRDSELYLSCHGRDRVIHDLWARKCCPSDPWAAFAEAGFSAVFAPDYSLWDDAPRAEHILESERSLVAARLIGSRGTPAVPQLFLHNDADIRRWAEWLCQYPQMTTIAVNLQFITKRLKSGVPSVAEAFGRLARGSSTHPRGWCSSGLSGWTICGASHLWGTT